MINVNQVIILIILINISYNCFGFSFSKLKTKLIKSNVILHFFSCIASTVCLAEFLKVKFLLKKCWYIFYIYKNKLEIWVFKFIKMQ